MAHFDHNVLRFQFAMVEVVNTCLTDAFNGRLLKFFKRKEFLVLFVCVIAFLLGIPNLMEVRSW